MIGPAAILLLAATLVVAAYLAAIAHRLRHPPRRTLGWALGRGVPGDPDGLGRPLAWREETLEVAGSAAVPLAIWRLARSEQDLEAPARAVVLLHGWGHGRRDGLDRLAPFLAARGTVVLMPDLRGHGDSPGASGLGDLDEIDLLELLATLSPLPTLLVGHSMGGVAAIHAAAAVSAGGPHASIDLRGVIAISPYERLRVPIAADLRRRGHSLGVLRGPLLALLRLRGIRERSTAASASQIGVPLLVIHGEEDDFCPRDAAAAIADAAAQGQFVPIPHGGHADLWRRHREAIETAIASFSPWTDLTSPAVGSASGSGTPSRLR